MPVWENVNGNYDQIRSMFHQSNVPIYQAQLPVTALNRPQRAIQTDSVLDRPMPTSNPIEPSTMNSGAYTSPMVEATTQLGNVLKEKINNPNGLTEPQLWFRDTLMEGGLSRNQALAVLMNINAENRWDDKYLYGNYMDTKRRAYGALSWQGGRETALLNDYKQAGLIDANGNVKAGKEALVVQAKHFLRELNSSEKGNAKWFMANRDIDPIELAINLNKRVIRSNQSEAVLKARLKAYQDLLRRRG